MYEWIFLFQYLMVYFSFDFFFLWYFLILVPFQLAKKNMDLASLKNELSQSEARLTEQVCTIFSASFSIFSCSHFAFLCLAQLVEKPLFILKIKKAGRLRLHSIFEHLCWSWSLGALQFRVCMVLQKIILLVCLNFQFLLNEQNAEATNQSERTSNLQYQLGVAQVSMKCNWVSIVQFLGSGCVSKIRRKERTKRNREFSEKVIERSVCLGWKRVFGGKQCEKDVEVFSSFL